MIEIFSLALKFKAKIIVGKDLFEMVLYPPKTPFDKAVMLAETMAGDGANLSLYEEPKVKIWLLPSFHVYDSNKKMVEYNSFVRRDDGQRSRAHRLTKATVILENPQARN